VLQWNAFSASLRARRRARRVTRVVLSSHSALPIQAKASAFLIVITYLLLCHFSRTTRRLGRPLSAIANGSRLRGRKREREREREIRLDHELANAVTPSLVRVIATLKPLFPASCCSPAEPAAPYKTTGRAACSRYVRAIGRRSSGKREREETICEPVCARVAPDGHASASASARRNQQENTSRREVAENASRGLYRATCPTTARS